MTIRAILAGDESALRLLPDTQACCEAVQLPPPQRPRPARLFIRNGNRMPVVRFCDIEYFEADGNYVKLFTDAGAHRFRGTVHSILENMDPLQFALVHRGTVVNLDRVREVQPWLSGDFEHVMPSGAKLRLSRTYNDVLDLIAVR